MDSHPGRHERIESKTASVCESCGVYFFTTVWDLLAQEPTTAGAKDKFLPIQLF